MKLWDGTTFVEVYEDSDWELPDASDVWCDEHQEWEMA